MWLQAILAMVCVSGCHDATTRPAVYYVPEPVYHYQRRALTPKAAHDIEQLENDMKRIQDILKQPPSDGDSPP